MRNLLQVNFDDKKNSAPLSGYFLFFPSSCTTCSPAAGRENTDKRNEDYKINKGQKPTL
jgi:hypothetical protein